MLTAIKAALFGLKEYKQAIVSIAIIAVILLSLRMAFNAGVDSEKVNCDLKIEQINADIQEATNKAIADALADHVKLQADIEASSAEFQKEQGEANKRERVIEREVIKYVQKNPNMPDCTMSDDGVQLVKGLIQSANSGRDPRARTEN